MLHEENNVELFLCENVWWCYFSIFLWCCVYRHFSNFMLKVIPTFLKEKSFHAVFHRKGNGFIQKTLIFVITSSLKTKTKKMKKMSSKTGVDFKFKDLISKKKKFYLQVNCYAARLLFWKEDGVQKVLNFLVFRWTICGGYSKTFFHLNLFNGLKRFNAAKNLENLVFWPNNNFSLVFIQYKRNDILRCISFTYLYLVVADIKG